MPLIQFTAGLTTPNGLCRALAQHPKGAPVIVMIHGYKFAPHSEQFCPFQDIFAPIPPARTRAVSWPRHLGLGRSAPGCEPLCIAFGWFSRGSFWQAAQGARDVGAELAMLLRIIAQAGHVAGIIAHSLGAQVALSALRLARPKDVGRVVLMAGAAFAKDAQTAMNSPAGRHTEVLNITSRENAFYDLVAEIAFGFSGRSIGRGMQKAPAGWIDLWIDDTATRETLRRMGHPIARPVRKMCHWSGYLRPGLFHLYRQWLSGPTTLHYGALASQIPPRPIGKWRLPRLVRFASAP